jgi:hypothetical protein
MVEIGYKLASEEHGAPDPVCNAREAEDARFASATIPLATNTSGSPRRGRARLSGR